jgi:hypothetical protein
VTYLIIKVLEMYLSCSSDRDLEFVCNISAEIRREVLHGLVNLGVVLEYLQEDVVEGPHGIRSTLVHSSCTVVESNAEVSSHHFVTSYLRPSFLSHFGFNFI